MERAPRMLGLRRPAPGRVVHVTARSERETLVNSSVRQPHSTAAKLALLLALVAVPAAASAGLVRPASLIGQTVTFHVLYEDNETTDMVEVTGKPEISCPGNFEACQYLNAPKLQTIDIGANSVTYRYTGPGAIFDDVSPNAFYIEGLNLPKPIAGVELHTNIPGLTPANVSFTATTVTVNMSGLTVPGPRSYFRLVLQTRL